jgi:hypothetical protein
MRDEPVGPIPLHEIAILLMLFIGVPVFIGFLLAEVIAPAAYTVMTSALDVQEEDMWSVADSILFPFMSSLVAGIPGYFIGAFTGFIVKELAFSEQYRKAAILLLAFVISIVLMVNAVRGDFVEGLVFLMTSYGFVVGLFGVRFGCFGGVKVGD